MLFRNSLSKPAQFSFAADLFMLQAILRSDQDEEGNNWQLQYTFPRACYKQIIEWILDNPDQIGFETFNGVLIGQCTFSYGNEYAVIAAEEKILDQVVSIYDIYLGALRNLLGQEILN